MKILRFSQLPVKLENLQKYKEEWKFGFDEAMDKYKENMAGLQPVLEALEQELLAKYPATEDELLPETVLGWTELVKQYQCPVMVAQSADDPTQLVMVIMDMPLT